MRFWISRASNSFLYSLESFASASFADGKLDINSSGKKTEKVEHAISSRKISKFACTFKRLHCIKILQEYDGVG